MGEQFTIADIALWPWVRNMVVEQGYNAAEPRRRSSAPSRRTDSFT